jgi:hypothetical protein
VSDLPGAVSEDAGVVDAFVLDAATRQSLTCVRSLGRAGLRVALGERVDDCDGAGQALAFRSRYSACNVVLPNLAADARRFGAAVVDFVRARRPRMLLPGGDASIGAMRPWRQELASLGCVLAVAAEPALDIANDKDRTLEVAAKLGIPCPQTMLIDSADQLDDVLAAFEFPFVLKPTNSWMPAAAGRLHAVEVVSRAEAAAVISACHAAGASCLAQEYASGRREGFFLFVADGEIRASWAHMAHRTVPALGGASVLRQSIPLPPDTYESAVRLIEAIGLEGPCEVEFRRDAAGRPLLMEINARVGGTIDTAIRSGVDFPLMTWQWATGQPVSGSDGYAAGVRVRWLRGDLRWLRNNFGRPGRPDSMPRGRALATFLTEFARTRRYDSLDVRDLGPARAEVRMTLAGLRNVKQAARGR